MRTRTKKRRKMSKKFHLIRKRMVGRKEIFELKGELRVIILLEIIMWR